MSTAENLPDDPPTAGAEYAERLRSLSTARWKRWLDVQAPYRAHLRRLHLGRTLDVGCGTGRNLRALDPGSVGVDHNPFSVALARQAGFTAYTWLKIAKQWATAAGPCRGASAEQRLDGVADALGRGQSCLNG